MFHELRLSSPANAFDLIVVCNANQACSWKPGACEYYSEGTPTAGPGLPGPAINDRAATRQRATVLLW